MLNSPDGRFNLAFTGYAYHCQQIEDFIGKLIEAEDPNDPEVQQAIADELGLSTDSLDIYDIDYIESEVTRRRQ
jgi:hypothetical protein